MSIFNKIPPPSCPWFISWKVRTIIIYNTNVCSTSEHVKKVEDVVSLGDEILVKCLGYDKKGRLNFSRRDALEPQKEIKEEK